MLLNNLIATFRTEKTMTDRRDKILRFFLCLEIGQFSPHLGAISLFNYTEDLERREKLHWRKFQKIQWRQLPEIVDFCPLSKHFVLLEVCICRVLVAGLRIGTTFIGDFFRESLLWEQSGQTDKISHIACPLNQSMSASSLLHTLTQRGMQDI